MDVYPSKNLTWSIINDAKEGGYAVGGFCVYSTEGVLAIIKAAERVRSVFSNTNVMQASPFLQQAAKAAPWDLRRYPVNLQSPAIIQVFPWTMHFQGFAFIKFIADTAHAASVPIALHLDHCLKPSDAELALECAFDSIMVDGSMFEEEENIKYVKSVVEKAKTKGMTIEAELGRMDGKEDGVPEIGLESVWTDPGKAARFVKDTGVHFLAPSFGNVHGPYPEGGAEKCWQLDRLQQINEQVHVPLVLHGTHPLSDDMMRVAMKLGIVKVNLNRGIRGAYHEFMAKNAGSGDLITLQENAVEVYSREIERVMVSVFESAGKA